MEPPISSDVLAERIRWIQTETNLGQLSAAFLHALATRIQVQQIPAQHQLIRQDQPTDGLYLLHSGRMEAFQHSEDPSLWATSLLPGAVLHLPELLLHQNAQRTINSLTEAELWWLPAAEFTHLLDRDPEAQALLTRQLAQDLTHLQSQLAYELERQLALRPYLVPKAKRGIVGKSRYAVRLRQQITQASQDARPVLIFGEPGLEKDNIAALIHFGSAVRREPMIQVNCSQLQPNGSDLLGRVGGKPGLLEWVGRGTILLNNLQDLPPELVPVLRQLLQDGTYQPLSSRQDAVRESGKHQEGDTAPAPRPYQARILMVAEKPFPELDEWVGHSVKVPPLRVRKADLKDQLDYYLTLAIKQRGIRKPAVTPEALRRLQSYDFPGNLRELQALINRALVQAGGNNSLTEEIFWATPARKRAFRLNLINANPWLRRWLGSPWWPDRINLWVVMPVFAGVVALLFWGPQDRAHNVALNLFWAWWWPLILLLFPVVGRLWCAYCPFMIYGEVVQKLSLWLVPRPLRQWPRQQAERWGGWFLWGLFALIFVWEELWNLADTAYLSACLLLLITAGAVIGSLFYERRFWCRYLCPIGGMNGLYAKLSVIELRAQQGICSAECTTYQCYKGGPRKGEGQETLGCPVYSHPAQLTDNRDCVLCMTCLKACPHRSVELNLRPPGIELWTTHTPRAYEVALLLLLLGGVFLHRLPEGQDWLGIPLDLSGFWPHLGVALAALSLPAVIPGLGYAGIRLLLRLGRPSCTPRSFVELAYGYLPLVWGGSLAHYLRLGLTEAGRILPVTWATFGISGGETLPIVVGHPAVIAFLQGSTLSVAFVLAVILTQKIARQPFWILVPQHCAALLITGIFWQVMVNR